MLKESVLGGKIRAWTEKKCSLRNEKLKANRASRLKNRERKAEEKTRKGNGRPQESALGHSQKIVAG